MNLDFLKPVLGDELFAQFAAAVKPSGMNLVNIADGSYIPKAKFDEKIAAVNQLTTDLANAQAQIQAEQAKNATVNELQAKVDQLTQDVAARDQQLHAQSLDYTIKDALRAAKARNVDVVIPLLKREDITVKDGKLEGFDAQLTTIKQSYPYLFESDNPGSQRGGYSGQQDIIGGASSDSTNAAMNNALRSMAGRA